MDLPESLVARLARLAPDQRAAATAPAGPILCVAPAGSGKTTTLVARIAWLIANGVRPAEVAAITFNRKAAVELAERLDGALDWPEARGGAEDGQGVRVRTFHALGLEILRSTGKPVGTLASREAVLRAVAPEADRARLAHLDAAISRLKLDLDVTAEEVAADPDAGPVARTYVAYEAALARAGTSDFDDLVRLAVRALEGDAALLAGWRRCCGHLLVDETQDVDRSQLRLALLLAAPANRIFLVGDDDQSIYGWRLADVRRVLSLAAQLPGLRRIDLEVNYRCPAPVLARAVRLVEHNRERFAKAIRAGPASTGRLVLAPDGGDDVARIRRLLATWGRVEGTSAILARTNRELLPAAAVALDLGIEFRAPGLRLLIEDPALADVLRLVAEMDPTLPLLVRIGAVRAGLAQADVPTDAPAEVRRDAPRGAQRAVGESAADGVLDGSQDEPDDRVSPDSLAAALLGWAVPHREIASLAGSIETARRRLVELRRDDARLTLATAHSTKGLEFDHVGVIGMDDGRFPSARAVSEAENPRRALEEERRLAYVAWTRARRSLTLVYDPAAPSGFLLEAFSPEELLVAGAS